MRQCSVESRGIICSQTARKPLDLNSSRISPEIFNRPIGFSGVLLRLSYISMGKGLEQWRASIGLFNSKCIIKHRVRVNVSMAFIFNYMMYFLKLAVSSTFKFFIFSF